MRAPWRLGTALDCRPSLPSASPGMHTPPRPQRQLEPGPVCVLHRHPHLHAGKPAGGFECALHTASQNYQPQWQARDLACCIMHCCCCCALHRAAAACPAMALTFAASAKEMLTPNRCFKSFSTAVRGAVPRARVPAAAAAHVPQPVRRTGSGERFYCVLVWPPLFCIQDVQFTSVVLPFDLATPARCTAAAACQPRCILQVLCNVAKVCGRTAQGRAQNQTPFCAVASLRLQLLRGGGCAAVQPGDVAPGHGRQRARVGGQVRAAGGQIVSEVLC